MTTDNTTESTNGRQTTAGMSAVSTANSTAVSTANSAAVSRTGDAVSSSRQEDNAVTSSSAVTVSSSPGKDKMVLSVVRFYNIHSSDTPAFSLRKNGLSFAPNVPFPTCVVFPAIC